MTEKKIQKIIVSYFTKPRCAYGGKREAIVHCSRQPTKSNAKTNDSVCQYLTSNNGRRSYERPALYCTHIIHFNKLQT